MNYPRKIFLVVDGLPAHIAKSVQRFLEQLKIASACSFFHPTLPEINPDELVWNDVKNNGLIRTPADLDHAVNSRLRLLQRNPDKVRAFFQTDATRYAAAA
jgi:DDE superfamily endonuclease